MPAEMKPIEETAGVSARSHNEEDEQSTRQRHVAFDTVHVYNFPITMGDSPACRDGCPIRLGDECFEDYIVDIDSFEEARIPHLRHLQELYLSVPHRAKILLVHGFSLEQIVNTVIEVEQAKKKRYESLRMNQWEKLNFAVDKAGRTLRRIIRPKQQQQQQGNDNKKKRIHVAMSA